MTAHDTPESVAARLDARVEGVLETCAARPSIAANATCLLSNFIGCVEKGRGSALDAGDGRAARFALELLERRDRAQAAEIARLSEDNGQYKHTFDLRWKADQRAIKRWQEATGRTDAWPDRADMVVMLLEVADAAEARATQAEAALAEAKKRYFAGIQRRYERFCRMRGRAEDAEDGLHALRHEIIEAAYKAWPEGEDVGYDAGNIIAQLAAERDEARAALTAAETPRQAGEGGGQP